MAVQVGQPIGWPVIAWGRILTPTCSATQATFVIMVAQVGLTFVGPVCAFAGVENSTWATTQQIKQLIRF